MDNGDLFKMDSRGQFQMDGRGQRGLDFPVERPFKIKWINTELFAQNNPQDFELLKELFNKLVNFDIEMKLDKKFEFSSNNISD